MERFNLHVLLSEFFLGTTVLGRSGNVEGVGPIQ